MMIWPYVFAALGAVLASLAGVISERLNTGESWIAGRSHCNSCDRTLSGLDLVPVLSWLSTGGKCRTCRASVPYRYFVAEVVLAGLFCISYLTFGLTLELALILPILFILMIIVLYDLQHTIVPLQLAFLLIALSGLYAYLFTPTLPMLSVTLLTAGGISLGFYLMHVLSGGRWMGLGDAPIALALSLLVGAQALSGLVFSFWTGAVIGIFILVGARKGHRMGIEVPFVPFLAAGYLLALFTQWNPFPF